MVRQESSDAARSGSRSLAMVGLLLAGPLLLGLPWLATPAAAAHASQFLWPHDGTVTSIYWECRSDCARWHRGIDIANGCGTNIHAARDGIATVGNDPNGYGNYVVVDHDDGYTTLYGHMSTVAVNSGDAVTTNTILGYEGQTGDATGCHVHFEVRQDDNAAVDTKQFVPATLNQHLTRGAAVPYAMKLLQAARDTSVLNGPNLHSVAGEGDAVLGTAQAGEAYVAFSSWTNTAGETWYASSFNGRVGWLRGTDVSEVGGTVQRIQVDTTLNVRSGAGTGNGIVGTVFGAQEYARLASAADGSGKTWYQIRYDGSDGVGTGWVHGDYGVAVTYQAPPPPAGNLSGHFIAVDPGHGGTDSGATGFGDMEKTFTLDIGLRVRDLLLADGANVLMTRDCDCTTSLQARTDAANNAHVDRFVSIHANACGACGGHGTETYYHSSLPSTSQAADMASDVQSQVLPLVGTTDRGVKQADFFVLRETTMPAVLIETAFIDEAGDHAILADAAKRQEFARGILHGIQAHLGVPVHDPAPPPPPADVDPPVITVTAPDLGAWYGGTVQVEATITDASALAWARAQVDSGTWAWDSLAPHQWTFDTTAMADGSHDLHVQAKDQPGNQADLHATLKVDNQPPTVTITEPQEGDIVFFSVTVQVDASDSGSGVRQVDFYIDGELRATDTDAPYEWTWNALFEPGDHTITARAVDGAGHRAEDSVQVFAL